MSDQELIFKDSIREGHPATIIHDAHGSVLYPSCVPPAVQSPSPAPRSRPPALSDPLKPSGLLQASTGPKKSKTEPLQRKPPVEISTQWRPFITKKLETEIPCHNSGATSTSRSRMTRVGTDISRPGRALCEPCDDDDTTSSSSSSETEDTPKFDGTASINKKDKKAWARDVEEGYRRFRAGNNQYRTKGKVSKDDGRLRITVKDTSNTGYLAKAIGAAVQKVAPGVSDDEGDHVVTADERLSFGSDAIEKAGPIPRLNVVIMVIGSRGDAQPFLKIGKVLKEEYGHRVRIATHPAFREFVEKDSGLEFFSVGGDPAELMAFMVKNPGMVPTLESVKAGEIGRRRTAMAEMFQGFWRACINATDDEKDVRNLRMMGEKDPFVADAIIANPPSFAHIHCAEALGIPLHLMFTFPYTPTQDFPHPLASIKKSNVDPGYTNFMSYPLVDMMVWQGLGDLVNEFRTKTLRLDPVSTLWAPGATYRLHVPFAYMWSPGLVAKPRDWGPEIDVTGFVFLDLASSFTPPDDLVKFLDKSEELPIYIGFGSIVVDDPDRFTQMIFDAVKMVGCRALVSKGWGGLGGKEADPPDNIYMLDNTPHDWLFPRVRACVIHGGAGTTAIALKCGKPTMVVPFFGDQHFWGSMISASHVGPEPIPYKHLNAEKLADGINFLFSGEAQEAASKIARDIEGEGDGAENAVRSFHDHLELDNGRSSMRCSILEDRVAVWRVKGSNIKLSALAAEIAVDLGLISWRKLRLLRHCEWNDFEGPGEPVTGLAGSIASTIGNVLSGVGGVPYRMVKSGCKRRERELMMREGKQKEKEKEKKNKEREGKGKEPAASNQNAHANDYVNRREAESEQNSHANSRASKSASVPEAKGKKKVKADDPSETKHPETAFQDTKTHFPDPDTQDQLISDVSEGVSRSAAALARAPLDLSLALAQGFHNAPRLYGDDTVRRPPRVTGIKSGLRAARREFVYGVYDGVTGVVLLPVRGARKNGFKGAAKGISMGIIGFVLKNIAALISPVGYTLKGVAKQIERAKGVGDAKKVRRGRIVQGTREWRALTRPKEELTRVDRIVGGVEEGGGEEQQRALRERVLKGWELLRELREVVAQREREDGKRGGIKQKLRWRRKVARGDFVVGVCEAEEALKRLRRGDSVEMVFDQKRGRLNGENKGDTRRNDSHVSGPEGRIRAKQENKDKGNERDKGQGEKRTTRRGTW